MTHSDLPSAWFSPGGVFYQLHLIYISSDLKSSGKKFSTALYLQPAENRGPANRDGDSQRIHRTRKREGRTSGPLKGRPKSCQRGNNKSGERETTRSNRVVLTFSKVKLAYMDDRKSKMLHDEREKERRAAHAAAMTQADASTNTRLTQPPLSPPRFMPESGQVLNGEGPPPYESNGDEN